MPNFKIAKRKYIFQRPQKDSFCVQKEDAWLQKIFELELKIVFRGSALFSELEFILIKEAANYLYVLLPSGQWNPGDQTHLFKSKSQRPFDLSVYCLRA